MILGYINEVDSIHTFLNKRILQLEKKYYIYFEEYIFRAFIHDGISPHFVKLFQKDHIKNTKSSVRHCGDTSRKCERKAGVSSQ